MRSVRRWRGTTNPRRVALAAVVAVVGIGVAACVPQPPPPPPPPAPAQLTISPGNQAFVDDAPRSGGQNEQFTVKNVGAQTSGVLGAPEIVGAGEFFASPGTCDDGDGRLAPNETCVIDVSFNADSGGGTAVAPSQVRIIAAPGGTATASLTGTEFDSTPIGVSYSDTDFSDSNTPGGDTITFIVNNPGATAADGFTAAIQNEAGFGTFAVDSSQCGTSAPAGSCLVFVTYTNDRGDGSTATAKLVVKATFSDSTAIDLTGIATGTPNVLSIDAGTGNIDDSFLDSSFSGPLVLTITNGGASSTGPLSAIFNGSSGEGQFGSDNDTCTGTVLAPGASCTYGVNYKAISPNPGTVTIQVTGTPGGFVTTVVTGTPTG